MDEGFLGSQVSSFDLNRLITQHGLDQWPNSTISSSAAGITQNSDVVHTMGLNLTEEANNTIEIAQLPNHRINPNISVVVEQRMVRFRYDSELNNRNFGKEILAKIVIKDFIGRVKIRIHAVDDKKLKAHPFCLIGDKCLDGVYIEEHSVAPDKTECICKATPRIPKQKNYEDELKKRKVIINDVNSYPLITPEMTKDEYWTANKNMKESKEIILMVEVICFDDNNTPLGYYNLQSEPINNAKDGKKFEIYAITPTSSSVLGSVNDSHFIILTADSYTPNESDVEVRFCDDGDWQNSAQHVKVIKNAIEFNFPGYCNPLSVEKHIYVYVYDKKKKLETSKAQIVLRPTDGDIIAHKRKKAFNPFNQFSLPTSCAESIKTEERPSCSAPGPRKIHHLKKRGGTGSVASPLDLAKLEEEGMISLNISSPMNHNDSSQSSLCSQQCSNSSFQDFNPSSSSLNSTIPNTIPALLIPSGSRDMQVKATMFGTQFPVNEALQQNSQGLNNMAITQTDIPLTQTLSTESTMINQATSMNTQSNFTTSINTSDISQQQTQTIGSLNQAQIQDILRFLATANVDQNAQNQYGGMAYDPHDIRIEDLADFDQNDVEVDGEISSSSEIKDICEKCDEEVEKSEKKPKNKIQSDKKITQNMSEKEAESDKKLTLKVSDKTGEIADSKTVLQSDVVSSNVDSDVEED